MNKIRIAHLYYDLMNLYGESGNIMALVKGFDNQDMDAEVIKLTIKEQKNKVLNKISWDLMHKCKLTLDNKT